MKLREDTVGSITVLEIDGRIDSSTAPALGERLSACLTAPGPRLVLDFARVDFITSAGFRVLLLAGRQAQSQDGRLVLCALPEKVRMLFEIVEFGDVFTIYGSRKDGLAALA